MIEFKGFGFSAQGLRIREGLGFRIKSLWFRVWM